jgi:hypothetical protein
MFSFLSTSIEATSFLKNNECEESTSVFLNLFKKDNLVSKYSVTEHVI